MADVRPVLLGMNNPVSSRPEHALFPYPPGCTGWRILELLRLRVPEVTRAQYLAAFDRRNLVDGKIWSREKARAAAARLPLQVVGRTVVVFGEEPRRALDLPKMLLHPLERDGVTWRQLPHPSGHCRWYNDPECANLAALLLEELYRCS